MTLLQLLHSLQAARVRITVADRDIQYRAPAGAMTPALVGGIRRHKDALLDLLEGRVEPRPSVFDLANTYRRLRGGGFREAFIEATGCDFWAVTPAWIDLYTFEAWLSDPVVEDSTPSSLLGGLES